MKLLAAMSGALALSGFANAHYLFGRLILDGQWTKTWEYVREVSSAPNPSDNIGGLVYPQIDPTSIDMRCGRNTSRAHNAIKTATVTAGDTVGFAAGEPILKGDLIPWMYHPGWAAAWLSKSPTDDLDTYAGDGDWVKIMTSGGREEQSVDFEDPFFKPYWDPLKGVWGTYRAESWNFTIPDATPSGKYLLRFEHIFPNPDNAQWFINCAQIEVLNPSDVNITPAPTAKIPGVYTYGQKDIYFAWYNMPWPIEEWKYPAPTVWTGN
jgi:hypothetical protein